MALVSMTRILDAALANSYAVGYFEAWDQYSLEAVLEAAEEQNAPVILGFGGMNVDPSWFDHFGVEALGALGRSAAQSARVPVSLFLNEAQTFPQIARGILCGFNAVMLDTSHLPFQENVVATRQVVDLAHAVGVTVQAELGQLPSAFEGQSVHGQGVLTDPQEAARFVRETGVDALSVSVGNVHLMMGKVANIDFDRLSAIHQVVPVPLVIHGGTSFPTEGVKEAISRGVALFHVGTVLKRDFLEGMRLCLGSAPAEVSAQKMIGSRTDQDVANFGKQKVKARVAKLIRTYGSAGEAATVG